CGDGELTATVWIRPQSYQDVVAEADRIRDPAERIASAVCDENGDPVFTVADITGEADPQRGPLDGWLTVSLLKAISEVWSGKTA
ncbi:TPA: phage tail assembly chaperone family protein, TAC, partial [Escherichia coli]|nr:phage tail assembly chaperone family protein, TAC [Escherichia coli]